MGRRDLQAEERVLFDQVGRMQTDAGRSSVQSGHFWRTAESGSST